MGLQISYSDDLDNTYPTAYVEVIESNLNYADRQGRLVLGVWKDRDAHKAGKRMAGTFAYALTKDGTPPTLDSKGNVTDPGFISFDQFCRSPMTEITGEDKGLLAIDKLFGVFYGYIKIARPEFAKAEDA